VLSRRTKDLLSEVISEPLKLARLSRFEKDVALILKVYGEARTLTLGSIGRRP
jgi:hypothetical protein